MKVRSLSFGAVLIEILVAALLASILVGVTSTDLIIIHRQTHDQSIRLATRQELREVRQQIGQYLSLLGVSSGFPVIHRFPLSDISTDLLPVTAGATTDSISFWGDETGETSALQQPVTLGTTTAQRTLLFPESSRFAVNDWLAVLSLAQNNLAYARGRVTAVAADSVTINAAYLQTPGATFPAGTLVRRPIFFRLYQVTPDQIGIQRNGDVTGTQVIGQRSTITFEYLDAERNLIPTPLSAADSRDRLVAVRVVVDHRARRSLLDGTVFAVQGADIFFLDNLVRGE